MSRKLFFNAYVFKNDPNSWTLGCIDWYYENLSKKSTLTKVSYFLKPISKSNPICQMMPIKHCYIWNFTTTWYLYSTAIYANAWNKNNFCDRHFFSVFLCGYCANLGISGHLGICYSKYWLIYKSQNHKLTCKEML